MRVGSWVVDLRTITTRTTLGARTEDNLIIFIGVVGLAGWAICASWYPLPALVSLPHLDLGKIPGRSDTLSLTSAAILLLGIVLAYAVGYGALKRAHTVTGTMKAVIVLLVGSSMAANILIYPVGALDVFNYVMQLKVAYHYGANPYLTTFQSFPADPFFEFAFLANIPLFYGPVWLYLSWLPVALTGFHDLLAVLLALKAFNCVLLLLTGLSIFRYHGGGGEGWRAAYLFLANPLVLFEGVANAHNDVMMGLFLVIALLALRLRSVLAVPFLTLSALVKFFTAPLLPLLILATIRQGWTPRPVIASCLLSFSVAVAAFAPVWAGGKAIDGLLHGADASQEMNSASAFSLAREYLRLQGASERLVAATRPAFGILYAAVVAVCLWRVWRGQAIEQCILTAYLAFCALLSLLYPWYLLPAIAVIALRPEAATRTFLFTVTVLGLAYYPLSIWAWSGSGFSTFQVHLFQALLLNLPIVMFLLFWFRGGRRRQPRSL